MRVLAGVCSVIALAGCGELTGASEYADWKLQSDAGYETSRPQKGPNDLTGDYQGVAIPRTLGAFRIERRSHPTQPWLVFVSLPRPSPGHVECKSFENEDWHKTMPGGSFIHVLWLGKNTDGDFKVTDTSPPLDTQVMIGRTQPTATEFQLEYATAGSLNLATFTHASTSGAFMAEFPPFYAPTDDPEPFEQHVEAMFNIETACSVDW